MYRATTLCLKPRPASVARRALWVLASMLSDAYAARVRQRQIRATAHVLGQLDDHLLRDLAIDRSELLSAAAEVHGWAEPQRRHAVLATLLPR